MTPAMQKFANSSCQDNDTPGSNRSVHAGKCNGKENTLGSSRFPGKILYTSKSPLREISTTEA